MGGGSSEAKRARTTIEEPPPPKKRSHHKKEAPREAAAPVAVKHMDPMYGKPRYPVRVRVVLQYYTLLRKVPCIV